MEENKQLVLFESQLAEVPKTRAKYLVKVADAKGLDFAINRNLSIDAGHVLGDSVKRRIERHGTSSKNLYMTRRKQCNTAVGINSIKDPTVTIGQLGLLTYTMHEVAGIIDASPNTEKEKEDIKAFCEAVRNLRQGRKAA